MKNLSGVNALVQRVDTAVLWDGVYEDVKEAETVQTEDIAREAFNNVSGDVTMIISVRVESLVILSSIFVPATGGWLLPNILIFTNTLPRCP